MSAKLTFNKKGNAMAFFGNNEKPWWWGKNVSGRSSSGDFGYLHSDQKTAKEALEIISDGDEFKYSESLITHNNQIVDGYKMVINDAIGEVVSIVGEKYHVQQPSHFAETIDKIFAGQFVVDTFGALDKGRLLFATCKVREDNFTDGKEGEMIRMLSFVGSCDYTVPFRVAASSIRVQCWNKFQAHLRSSKSMFSARHTPNMAGNIMAIRDKIKFLYRSWEDLDLIMRELKEEKVSKEDIANFSMKLFDYDKQKSSERTKNQVRDVYKFSMLEAREFGYNRLAMLNGTTEFISHPERRTHGSIKVKETFAEQEIRLRLGEFSTLTDKALGLLTEDRLELAGMLN